MPATVRLIASLSPRMTLASRAVQPTALAQLTSALAATVSATDLSLAASSLATSQLRAVLVAGGLSGAEGVRRATEQVAAIGSAAFGAGEVLRARFERITQALVSPSAARGVQEWARRNAAAFQAILQGVTGQIEDVHTRLPELTLQTGWVTPVMDETPSFLVQLSDLTNGTPGAARRELKKLYAPSGRRFRRLTRRLHHAPVLVRHRVALRQGLGALNRGHHYAAICTLLPLVEAALHEVIWPGGAPPFKTSMTTAWRTARTRHQDAERDLDRPRLSSSFADLSFSLLEGILGGDTNSSHLISTRFDRGAVRDDAALDRGLNRNAILHGAAASYGRQDNAVRTALLLVAVSELAAHDLAGEA